MGWDIVGIIRSNGLSGLVFDVCDYLFYHHVYFGCKVAIVTNLNINILKNFINQHYRYHLEYDIFGISNLETIKTNILITTILNKDVLKYIEFNELYFVPNQIYYSLFDRVTVHNIKKIWFQGLKIHKPLYEKNLLIYSTDYPLVFPMKDKILSYTKILVYKSPFLANHLSKIYDRPIYALLPSKDFFSMFDSMLILDSKTSYQRPSYTPRLPLEIRYFGYECEYLGSDKVIQERVNRPIEFFSFPDLEASPKWFISLPRII